MYDKSNTFLKSPEEIDFDLEANLRAINSDLGRNRPKDYQIQDEEIENSFKEDSDVKLNKPRMIFSPKN